MPPKGKGVVHRPVTRQYESEPPFEMDSSAMRGPSGTDTLDQASSSRHASPTETVEQEQERLRRETEALQELSRMRERKRQLLEELQTTEGASKRARHDSSSSSDRDRDYQVSNTRIFQSTYTFRQRREWVNELEIAFRAGRKKLNRDEKKILYALDHMDADSKMLWYRHLDELKAKELRDEAWSNYAAFEDWTASILKGAERRELDIANHLEKMKQYPTQSPREFDIALDAAERQLELRNDKARAILFYTKLNNEFKTYLDIYGGSECPTSRDKIVLWAQNRWDAWKKKDKRGPEEKDNGRPRNTPRGNHSANPSTRNGSRANRGRRGGSGSNRGSSQGASHQSTQAAEKAEESGQKNPVDQTGKTMRCYDCDSEYHFSIDCPNKAQVSEMQRTGRGRGRGSWRGRGRNASRGSGNERAP